MFLTDKSVAARYCVSRPTIWGWVREDPTFPKPIKFSPGCTRWKLSEIEAWEAAKAGEAA